MKETPIIMGATSVQGILADRKSQTRRIFKLLPDPRYPDGYDTTRITQILPPSDNPHASPEAQVGWTPIIPAGEWPMPRKCPYGLVGDRLWVREGTVVHASIREQLVGYHADGCKVTEAWEKGVASRFMRRAHCRIVLELTDVRVERVQEITQEDAQAEGAEGGCTNCGSTPCLKRCFIHMPDYRDGYANMWMSINGRKSWDANVFVWVLSFKRV